MADEPSAPLFRGPQLCTGKPSTPLSRGPQPSGVHLGLPSHIPQIPQAPGECQARGGWWVAGTAPSALCGDSCSLNPVLQIGCLGAELATGRQAGKGWIPALDAGPVALDFRPEGSEPRYPGSGQEGGPAWPLWQDELCPPLGDL